MFDSKNVASEGFSARMHKLFYSLSYICGIPVEYRAVIWLLEKSVLLIPLLLLILDATPWDALNSGLINFNVNTVRHDV